MDLGQDTSSNDQPLLDLPVGTDKEGGVGEHRPPKTDSDGIDRVAVTISESTPLALSNADSNVSKLSSISGSHRDMPKSGLGDIAGPFDSKLVTENGVAVEIKMHKELKRRSSSSSRSNSSELTSGPSASETPHRQATAFVTSSQEERGGTRSFKRRRAPIPIADGIGKMLGPYQESGSVIDDRTTTPSPPAKVKPSKRRKYERVTSGLDPFVVESHLENLMLALPSNLSNPIGPIAGKPADGLFSISSPFDTVNPFARGVPVDDLLSYPVLDLTTNNLKTSDHSTPFQSQDLSEYCQKLHPFAVSRGGNSDIYKAQLIQGSHPHKDQLVAVKVLRSVRIRQGTSADDVLQKRFQREMQAWSRLDHCNVVPFLGFAFEGDFPCLVAPWYKNGDLTDYIRSNPDSNRTQLVTESIDGLVYLHSLEPPVIHGDLKASNILVDDDGKARITDFGLSRVLQNGPSGFTTSSTPGGTHRWMAPELLDGVVLRPTTASDVYALVLLALEIYTEKQPFPDLDQGRFFRAIFKGQSPERSHYSPFNPPDQIWQVFERGWSFDPALRPTAIAIKNLFSNALTETGWQER